MKWTLKNLKMDKQDAGKTVDVLVKTATKNGIASDAAIQNALDPAVKASPTKRKDLVDYSLLREVNQELGIR